LILQHASRNALVPLIALGALDFGALLSGAVLTKQVFTISGFGKLIVDAVFNCDYAAAQSVALCTARAYIPINLIADPSLCVRQSKAPGMTAGSGASGSRSKNPLLERFWDTILFWRQASGVLATLSLALLVAAIVARDPPEFSSMPVIAVVRDGEQRPIWAIRLASAAHQIAADSVRVAPVPAGHAYQLWLSVPDAPVLRQLGLLPQSGRKRIAVSPHNAHLLSGAGELVVTLEPLVGSPGPAPGGQVVFRATLESPG
jgi:hypothetical protein